MEKVNEKISYKLEAGQTDKMFTEASATLLDKTISDEEKLKKVYPTMIFLTRAAVDLVNKIEFRGQADTAIDLLWGQLQKLFSILRTSHDKTPDLWKMEKTIGIEYGKYLDIKNS